MSQKCGFYRRSQDFSVCKICLFAHVYWRVSRGQFAQNGGMCILSNQVQKSIIISNFIIGLILISINFHSRRPPPGAVNEGHGHGSMAPPIQKVVIKI